MKKILYFLMFSLSTLASSLNIVACFRKHKEKKVNKVNKVKTQKFDLKNLQINFSTKLLKLSSTNPFKIMINGSLAYQEVIEQIISQYQKIFLNSNLSSDNFNINSLTTDEQKTWALKIINGNKVEIANTEAVDLQVDDDKLLANDDNSVNIIIKTTDKNVLNQSITVKGYFQQYLFTNQDVNKNNNEIFVQPNRGATRAQRSATAANLVVDNVIDLSSDLSYLLTTKKKISVLQNDINNLSNEENVKIYNLILTAINKNFSFRMKNVKGAKKAAKFNTENVHTYLISSTSWAFIDVLSFPAPNDMTHILDDAYLQLQTNHKIFWKIAISEWNYLQENNYLCSHDTFVYLYLGTVQ